MADLGDGAGPIWLATAEWLGNPVWEAASSGAIATGISDARRRGEIAFELPLEGTVVKQPDTERPTAAKSRQRTDTRARTRDMETPPLGFCLGNRCFGDAQV